MMTVLLNISSGDNDENELVKMQLTGSQFGILKTLEPCVGSGLFPCFYL